LKRNIISYIKLSNYKFYQISSNYNFLLLFLLTFRQPLLPSSERLTTRCINFHASMTTSCPPQIHLVDSRSDEGSSGCRNVNKIIKGCNLINLL